MSRGIGVAQRKMLDALRESNYLWMTVAELADQLKRSPRQVRTAAHSLAERGLVVLTRECLGWNKGIGRLGYRWPGDRDIEFTVEAGEKWKGRTAIRRAEFYRTGTPVHGLAVWLPEQYQRKRDNEATALANLASLRGAAT